MRRAAGARRAEVEYAGLRAPKRDELLEVRRFYRRIHRENEGYDLDQTDRRDAFNRVVRQFVERRIRGITRRHYDDRVTVRVGARHRLGADRTPGAGTIIDDELLAVLVRQP